MRRYFDFVSEHGPGFSALLRGGSTVGSPSANATIDSVRQHAYEQMLLHLELTNPGPRLALVIRSWVGLAETTALTWLEDRSIPREELQLQLVHNFVALAAVSATTDEETAALVRRLVASEPVDGPFGDLVNQLLALASEELGPGPWGGRRRGFGRLRPKASEPSHRGTLAVLPRCRGPGRSSSGRRDIRTQARR